MRDFAKNVQILDEKFWQRCLNCAFELQTNFCWFCFSENSWFHSKFLTLVIYNHRHLAWKIYRQGFQNCIVRVQTLFWGKVSQGKLQYPFQTSYGKFLWFWRKNSSIFVRTEVFMYKKTYCLETVHLGRIKVTKNLRICAEVVGGVWRNKFGSVVKTACYESRRIFEEEVY